MLLLVNAVGLIFGSVHLDGSHSLPILIPKCCCAAKLDERADLGCSGLTNTPMWAASHLSLKMSLGAEEVGIAQGTSGGGHYVRC